MKHVTELGMQAQVMNDVVMQGFALVIDGAVLDDLPASIESHVVVVVRRSRAHTLTLKVTPKYVSMESILFETLRCRTDAIHRAHPSLYTGSAQSEKIACTQE